MASKSLNPFSAYGSAVCGERFVGREKELKLIKERVLGDAYANLSITGLPKIGKSSLAFEGIVRMKDDLSKDKTLVVYYQIGSTKSALRFYRRMIKKLHDEFMFYFPDDEKYNKYCVPIVDKINEAEIDDITDHIEDYYKRLRRWGYKIIYVLDEFDHAQDILEEADFQTLRELSYEPEDKICLVTCSRKTLDEIEKKPAGLSIFARTFADCPVLPFDKSSLQSYWNRVEQCCNIHEEYKNKVNYWVGGHPWLMDVINDYMFQYGDMSIAETPNIEDISLALMKGFDHVITTLQEEDLLNSAIQLCIGPYSCVDELQKAKLLKYGYLQELPEADKVSLYGSIIDGPSFDGTSYVCFSQFCTLDLHRRYYANVPYWALWSETENKLRDIIIEYLRRTYSSNWQSEMKDYLKNNLPWASFDIVKWEKNLESIKNQKAKLVANFPSLSSNHLVNFSLTAQLFDVFIRPAWGQWFCNVFTTSDRKEWNSKFEYLTKVRNPVGHNNMGLSETEMDIATRYCKEVCEAINSWMHLNS